MEYTYLLINFFTIVIPFAFSFHSKLRFYKNWDAFFPAVFITGAIFIGWDVWFTHLGIWGFNPRYLTGLDLFNLPIEEVLFFFCIPYACVFTYHCLELLLPEKLFNYRQQMVTSVLVIILIVLSVLFYENLYTAVTFISLSVLLLLITWIFKVNWLTKFYLVYAVLLIPFLIVNGTLTGMGLAEPVVWYNETEIIGLRILTIPVEDVFYGMELILMNVLLYETFKKIQKTGIEHVS